MIELTYGILVVTTLFYAYIAIARKSKSALLGVGGTVAAITVIALATSPKVINKVGSRDINVEPRLRKMENELSRIDTVQTVIVSDQAKLQELVDEMIELMNLERNSPKPAILWGPKMEKKAKEAEAEIEKQKEKLRSIVDGKEQE